MKVLFDHQIFSYQTHGGISRYFYELMNAFHDMDGVSFELALSYSDNAYIRELDGFEISDVLPFLKQSSRVRFLARYLLNRRVSNMSIRRGAFDVLHPTFFDPSFLHLLGGRPFVLTLHDMTPELFPELFPKRGLYARLVTTRWIAGMRMLAQKASRVIAISQNTKADAIRCYGLDPSKVVVICHASSLDPFAAAECPGLDLSRPFLLFVGSRFGYKNFDGFVRATAPLLKGDADLCVVCAGGGRFTDGEKVLFDSLSLHDRFIQMSASDQQLSTLYRSARAFVFPSRYEGFGIPIVEAFSCGCPCAVSRASCFPEIAGDVASYFDPNDLESITEGIRKVIYDESFHSELIARGLERAKRFSWETTARQTLGVYEDVLKETGDHQ